MRILLVEDEAGLVATLHGALKQGRYLVEAAPDLSTAREAVHGVRYDLVLLDRTLPDGDGLGRGADDDLANRSRSANSRPRSSAPAASLSIWH